MLSVMHLSKRFETGHCIVKAVDDISFEIKKGRFVSIVGKSGSGKSTLLHLIGGLDVPSNGSVFIDGTDLTHIREKKLNDFRRKKIGFVFQFFNLIPELNVHDNIKIAQQLSGTEFDREYYNRIIDILGLTNRVQHLPGQISGGERQRVAIARALVTKPKLLLLDEPTGNLDQESSDIVVNMMCDLKNEIGQTILMVTHDMESAHKSDEIITLRSGSLVSHIVNDNSEA